MDLELNTTSNYVVFDHNGVAGYYGWQVEVFTVQNKPAYQWVTNVKNYKLTDFFLQFLLPNGGYASEDRMVSGTYYPGSANPAVSIEVVGAVNSSGYTTGVYWTIYVNGVQVEMDYLSIPANYQAQQQTYESVLVTDDSSNLEFVSGSGYFTYYGGPVQKTCSGNTWNTVENSNMLYGNGFYKCWDSNGICSQTYNAPSGSWVTGYFVNPSNGLAWDKQAISDTGSAWLDGHFNPQCPVNVSVQFSGYEVGDPYSRDLSLTFSDGFSTDTLLNNVIVTGSFSYNFSIPQTYVDITNTAPAQIQFQLTTYVGTWYITSTIHYYQLQSCVS